VSEEWKPRRPSDLFAGERGAELESAFRTAWDRAAESLHDVPPPEAWEEAKPDHFVGVCSRCGGGVWIKTSSGSLPVASSTERDFFAARCPDPWRQRRKNRGI
jgi:hypothetical protein